MAEIPLTKLLQIDTRELGISALFAAVVLFVAAVTMLGRNVEQLRDSFSDAERSEAVLRQLDQVHLKLQGTEMTVRGYALSGDPVFLVYHKKVRAEIVVAMAALGELTRNEPDLLRDYTRLEKLVDRHQILQKDLLAADGDRRQAVANAITNAAQRAPREAVLSQLAKMDSNQSRILEARRKAATGKAQMTFGLAIGIAIFAFLAGSVGFAFTFMGQRGRLAPRHRW